MTITPSTFKLPRRATLLLAMESLVDLCVNTIACELLASAKDPLSDARAVEALLDQINLLPVHIGECFAARIQIHALKWRQKAQHQQYSGEEGDDDDEKWSETTVTEQTLWAALVHNQWLVDLKLRSLPKSILCSQHIDWKTLKLRSLDCSSLYRSSLADLPTLIIETLTLVGLHTLNLAGCDHVVTDSLLETLASQCQRLENLDVSHCTHVTDVGICTLIRATESTLRHLYLNGLRQLTGDATITAIENCVQLTTLELEDCTALTRLPAFAARLPLVTTLNLHKLSQLTDQQLSLALTGVFPRLTCLRLGESELSTASLHQLLQDHTESPLALQEVDLSWCTHLETDAIATLVHRSRALRILKLRCTQIDDSALKAIGSRSTNLRELDLERCDRLTGHGFDALVDDAVTGTPTAFQHLEKIHLSWTSVSVRVLSWLLSQCTSSIQKIDLQGCKELNGALVDAMVEMATSGATWSCLELMNCSWVDDITDEQLQSLADVVPHAILIGYYGTEIRATY